MENNKFKPGIDRMFWIILIFTSVLMLPLTVIPSIFYSPMLFFMIAIDIFVAYFLISPLFGYVELREKAVFIKFGFILKREIPYGKIRSLEKCRKLYSDSMVSLKNKIEHVNIKYNTFDVVSVSLQNNDAFIEELNLRIQ
jgi:hypothetical protein